MKLLIAALLCGVVALSATAQPIPLNYLTDDQGNRLTAPNGEYILVQGAIVSDHTVMVLGTWTVPNAISVSVIVYVNPDKSGVTILGSGFDDKNPVKNVRLQINPPTQPTAIDVLTDCPATATGSTFCQFNLVKTRMTPGVNDVWVIITNSLNVRYGAVNKIGKP